MTLNELVAQLVAVAKEPELWTTQHIADYLHRDVDAIRNRVVNMPGFPQAIRLPTENGTKGRPLWRSEEIKQWVVKYQESRVA